MNWQIFVIAIGFQRLVKIFYYFFYLGKKSIFEV